MSRILLHLAQARALRRCVVLAALSALAGTCAVALAQVPVLALEGLPRPATPPPEVGPVVPARVLAWRQQAKAYEHGDGLPRDPVRAAELYCRAARFGDAESQYSLAWMLTNSRGIERDDAQAAHLFAAAAEQGMAQAGNMLASMGTPRGAPPACLRQPDEERPPPAPAAVSRQAAAPPGLAPLPANAPAPIVNFVRVVAPEYKLEPHLVLAIIATESNFDPFALSPRHARGLMQLIPDTATRFNVRNPMDPAQNIRGGMAYLRWLMAYFEGDIALVAAAYNAGEGTVDRYRGVPPYAETRNYVRRILLAMGGQGAHPFDARVTAPSSALAAMRGPARLR
ncbi:MAG: transglycosylase SLT domain-containing protein [Rubrivivax sp.]